MIDSLMTIEIVYLTDAPNIQFANFAFLHRRYHMANKKSRWRFRDLFLKVCDVFTFNPKKSRPRSILTST